jgi:hypothetical protein
MNKKVLKTVCFNLATSATASCFLNSFDKRLKDLSITDLSRVSEVLQAFITSSISGIIFAPTKVLYPASSIDTLMNTANYL